MTTHDIGHKIAKLRQDRKLSQIDLSYLAGVGTVTIAHIETGKTNPRLSTLRQIADALGVKLTVEFE